MSEEEARKIIREDPDGNISKRIEALLTAIRILGEECTITDIMRWAEEDRDVENHQV